MQPRVAAAAPLRRGRVNSLVVAGGLSAEGLVAGDAVPVAVGGDGGDVPQPMPAVD